MPSTASLRGGHASHGRDRRARAAGIAGVFAAAFALAGCISAGEGRAIHVDTGEPIAGVEIRYRCDASRGLESWRTLRVVSALTDANGVYRFTRRQVRGCEAGALSAHKAGYVNLSETQSVWESVGGHTFQLIAADEEVMWRLKTLQRSTLKNAQNAHTGPLSSAESEYRLVFARFIASLMIAATDTEKAYVRDNYCARLDRLYAALPARQREALAGEKEWVTIRSNAKIVAVDHAAQVVAWCGAG